MSLISFTGKNSSTDSKNSKENKNMYIQLREREKKEKSSTPDGLNKKVN